MATAAEQLHSDPRIQTVLRLYEATNARDMPGFLSCVTSDVNEYLPNAPSISGAENAAQFWFAIVESFDAVFAVEHAIACDDEVAAEWSMTWTSPTDHSRHVLHGSEWYAFRDGLISELRAHACFHGDAADSGLIGFPYAERGYTAVSEGTGVVARASAIAAPSESLPSP